MLGLRAQPRQTGTVLLAAVMRLQFSGAVRLLQGGEVVDGHGRVMCRELPQMARSGLVAHVFASKQRQQRCQHGDTCPGFYSRAIFKSLTQVTSYFTQHLGYPQKVMAGRGVTTIFCQPGCPWPPPKRWQKRLGSCQVVPGDVVEGATLPVGAKG